MRTRAGKQTTKQKWIAQYAKRILKRWQSFKSRFEVSQNYIKEIQVQLSDFYEIPDEKMFIEMSYR